MKNAFVRCICRTLIVCMGALPFGAQASMIGADEVIAATGAQGAREKLRDFVGRSDVRSQLESHGIDTATAEARVNAMTDAEAASVAGRISELPAGGLVSGWAAIATAVIIGLIWYYWVK